MERDLTKKLGAKYLQSPQVTILIKEYNSQRVTIEGAVKTPHPAPAFRAKSAVVGDTASHERMRELEQNGRAPAEKKDDLTLKLPGYGAHAGGRVPRVRSRDAAKPITRVRNGVRSQRPAHRSSRP